MLNRFFMYTYVKVWINSVSHQVLLDEPGSMLVDK